MEVGGYAELIDDARSYWAGSTESHGDWAATFNSSTRDGMAEIPFIRRGNSAYVIVEGPTWEEAEANAVALGGHLVTIDDAEENDWLASNPFGYDRPELYIGARKTALDGSNAIEWASGALNTYLNWATTEPDDPWNSPYVALRVSDYNYAGEFVADYFRGTWRDLELKPEFKCIAEIPLTFNNTPTGSPTLSGSFKAGETIRLDGSRIADADNFEGWTPTYEYSWEISSDNGNTWSALTNSDATDGDDSYTITAAEAGVQLRGLVSYLDGYGTYETIAAYKPIKFLLNHSSGYKLLKVGQEIFLRNSRGRAFSDRSSRWWDAVKAVDAESGFEVLLEGTRGRRRGRYQVWSTNDSGFVTQNSGWKTGEQMLALGYEDTFDRDFNGDGFTGAPPAIDNDGNGLIDGSITYKLFKDNQAFDLTNSRGGTFSDRSSRWWDITQAIATGTGFQVLVEGQRGRRIGR